MADKIAIIGYACRLPGQVSTPEDLWELCTRGRSGWSQIPPERFSLDAYHHPNPLRPGTINPKGGYFLQDDISRFDASFFGLTAKEAVSLDPQQRLLLECTFEALEGAGLPRESLAGRCVGVYVGGNFADYELMNLRDLETTPMHQATGCAPAMQSNRISYFFDLRGPSMTFDTACSGSLVALHHAVRSLSSGESTEAIVAGCRLNLLPDYFVTMSMSQLFNDTGKTFAFDERADSGFARGEGAGVVILKPLQSALRDKDAIRAVVCNTGVGQDGRTLGITNPNGQAQRDLISKVYQDAGLEPIDCGFAEMHGTGTKVGDPIEAAAVHESLSFGRSSDDPLYIGSIKSNIGHLEGASGVVSVIKASLMLERELVLPNINFRSPNPAIPLHDWNMRVLKTTKPWPPNKKYVSVSNYGFGGTNAHTVLEKAPREARQVSLSSSGGEMDPGTKLFIVSANDREALQARIKDLSLYFEQRPEVFEECLPSNIAYTLGCRRSHLRYRLAIPASSLADFSSKMVQTRLHAPRIHDVPQIGFIFTGQGAQWARMGIGLLNEYPVFAASIKRADLCLHALGAQFSLFDELDRSEQFSRIDMPEISQPACTAIQIGLVDLLRAWGIQPGCVLGHSSGEIAAAYAAGAFDAGVAIALAYHRGNLTIELKQRFPSLKGSMIAVGLGREEIQPFLKRLQRGRASIACINSPTSVTVSGDDNAIMELHEVLDNQRVFNRQLRIDVAYHSDHMARVSNVYLDSIASYLPTHSRSAHFFSSVYGSEVDSLALQPSYWVKNLTSTVQFSDALTQMCSSTQRPDLLIEIGPHPALKGPVKDTLKALRLSNEKITYTPSLVRKENAVESILETAGAAFVRGTTLKMLAVNFPHSQGRFCSLLTDLPRYPWQHSIPYWHEARIAKKHASRFGRRNDVLGVIASYSNDLEPTWRNILRLDDIPWLRHHKMQGLPVFPFAGYLAMAIEAAQQLAILESSSFDLFELRDVVVSSALILAEGIDTETTITLRPHIETSHSYSNTWKEFRICSHELKRGWAEHCRGLIRVVDSQKKYHRSASVSDDFELGVLRKSENEIMSHAYRPVNEKSMYEALEVVGAGYGPLFQGLQDCLVGSEHCRGSIHVQDTAKHMPKGFEAELIIHPTLLDSFLHLTWPILGAGHGACDTLYMPTSVKSIIIQSKVIKTPGKTLQVWCKGHPDLAAPKPTAFTMHANSLQQSRLPLIKFEDFVMTPIRNQGIATAVHSKRLCYKLISEPLSRRGTPGKLNGNESAPYMHNSRNSTIVRTNDARDIKESINGVASKTSQNNSNGLANGNTVAAIGPNSETSNRISNGASNGATNGVANRAVHGAVNGAAKRAFSGVPNGVGNGMLNVIVVESIVSDEKETTNGNTTSRSTNNSNGLSSDSLTGYFASQHPEVVIVEFGDNKKLSHEVVEGLDQLTGNSTPLYALRDTKDWTGKRVIILQPGPKSLCSISTIEFTNLKDILLKSAQVLWVYGKDVPQTAASVGLARTVRSENSSHIITLGLSSHETNSSWPSYSVMRALDILWFSESDERESCDMEFHAKSGKLFVERIVEDLKLNDLIENEIGSIILEKQSFQQQHRQLKLQIGNFGALDTIYFVDSLPSNLGDHEIEIQVMATGVNFKDIVVCMGQISQPYIGVECSGFVTAVGKLVSHLQIGQRVMAMTEGAYSTYARCPETSAFPIENKMSFEEAATVPVVFCTALYGLLDLGRLAAGEAVLIHAAAGGVGQAAIMLAKMVGANIYATVGSEEKIKFLVDRYHIPRHKIFSSRDTSFGGRIRAATNNKGVDVVLNSLAGDILRETWECLAPFGRFIEIGKADITRNSRLDMLKFEHNCTFASVDLTKVAAHKPQLMRRLLSQVHDLMGAGVITPVAPITNYPISKVENALRALQSGKTIGKLVVSSTSDDQVLAAKPKISSRLFYADATYILVGGTGGLGRSIAKWMVSKGAHNIVLTSRNASKNVHVQDLVKQLVPLEAKITVLPVDVAKKRAVQGMKEALKGLPPVRGIVHGAMVLKDVLFEQMTITDFHEVAACKIDGAKNLHEVFADSPLDFFIALSSVAGIVGNRGQAAYAAANVFLDTFMSWRRSQGLPGVSIDLGAVSDVGYLADGSESRRSEVLKNIGGQTINEAEVLALLSAAVTGDMAKTCNEQCITGLGDTTDRDLVTSDNRFLSFRARLKSSVASTDQKIPIVSLLKGLRSSTSKLDAAQALCSALSNKIAAVLVIPVDTIEPSHTLKSLGLDSLVAIEIRNWISRETEVNLQVLELLSSGSIMNLAEMILGKMGI